MEEILEDIRNLLEQQLNRLERLTGSKAPAAPGGKSDEGGGVVGMLGKFVGALTGAVTAVLAFVALPPLMTAAVLPFVRALNPGLVEQFNTVLDNLQATIGSALEPVISQATLTLREWSSMLMPTLRELRPVIADLAHTISDVLVAALGSVLLQFRAWLAVFRPVITATLWLARLLAQLADAATTVMTVFFDMLTSALGVDDASKALGEALAWLKDIVVKCVQGLTFLLVSLLKLVGAMDTIAKLRAGLEKRIAERHGVGGGLVAAPKDVTTSGAEDIARKMSERAFAAVAGAGAARTETDILEGILSAVKDAEGMDLKRIITDAVRDGFKAAKDEAVKSVPVVGGVVSFVEDVSSDIGGRAERFFDDPLKSVFG